jgi:hypothetical protein
MAEMQTRNLTGMMDGDDETSQIISPLPGSPMGSRPREDTIPESTANPETNSVSLSVPVTPIRPISISAPQNPIDTSVPPSPSGLNMLAMRMLIMKERFKKLEVLDENESFAEQSTGA